MPMASISRPADRRADRHSNKHIVVTRAPVMQRAATTVRRVRSTQSAAASTTNGKTDFRPCQATCIPVA